MERKQLTPRVLDVTIEGEAGEGKSTLTWLLVNQLETFGAKVNVAIEPNPETDIGEKPDFVRQMHDWPHNLRPGHMDGLTVNITTKRVQREEI